MKFSSQTRSSSQPKSQLGSQESPPSGAPVWLTPVSNLLAGLDQQRLDAALNAFNRSGLHPNSRLGLAELQRLIGGGKAWDKTSPARKIEDRKKNEIVF